MNKHHKKTISEYSQNTRDLLEEQITLINTTLDNTDQTDLIKPLKKIVKFLAKALKSECKRERTVQVEKHTLRQNQHVINTLSITNQGKMLFGFSYGQGTSNPITSPTPNNSLQFLFDQSSGQILSQFSTGAAFKRIQVTQSHASYLTWNSVTQRIK